MNKGHFNAKTERKIKIAREIVLKFRVAKIAKDAILGKKGLYQGDELPAMTPVLAKVTAVEK